MGVRASYIANHSVNLLYGRNINQLLPSVIPFDNSRRPFPQYGNVTIRSVSLPLADRTSSFTKAGSSKRREHKCGGTPQANQWILTVSTLIVSPSAKPLTDARTFPLILPLDSNAVRTLTLPSLSSFASFLSAVCKPKLFVLAVIAHAMLGMAALQSASTSLPVQVWVISPVLRSAPRSACAHIGVLSKSTSARIRRLSFIIATHLWLLPCNGLTTAASHE